ncbi:HAD-IC family P-type ATPase [Patescibacteria group bacterium]|nr:HAD-IC family P-type ATPase [Patescibacteria group bacterium]
MTGIDKNWHSLSVTDIINQLGSDVDNGLSGKDVRERQEEFGKNKLPEEKPLSAAKILFEQFKSPLIYILIIAGFTVLLFQKYTDAIVIFGAVFLNAFVGFFQENKASKALRGLKEIVKQKARVIREGDEKIIDSQELVPGDIFELAAGDKVPVDGRLVTAYNLKINESALTGEWLAAEKRIDVLPQKTPLADRENTVYMGTIVEDGKGRAVVTAIGSMTEIGKIAEMVKTAKEDKTPLQKKLAKLSGLIGVIIFFISALIFFGGIIRGKDFVIMFETAVAVAVAAIPEGLPVAMTVILALGMQRILKRGGLVRKLLAAETLGSTSVIATDKTLTLTEGKMVVSEIVTAKDKFAIATEFFERPLSTLKIFKEDLNEDQILVLTISTLANEAFIENPKDPPIDWKIHGRPTDRALVLFGITAGLNKKNLEKQFPKIDEIPFNTKNKFIATLVKDGLSRQMLFVSGAPEKILSLSSSFQKDGRTNVLEEKDSLELNKKLEDLTGKGLRVVAVAYKKYEARSTKEQKNLQNFRLQTSDFKDLVFVGFIGLKDPLRKGVKEAIDICRKAGMKPIIVTGDHILTAVAVASELGFKTQKENIIEGSELDELSDDDFEKRLNKIQVYARVEPKHKIRIVSAWQRKGEVVAMTGDGINDAPALKKADIGIALGSGTDVAKEVSDLILLPDSFSIIVAAIEEGRVIIDNIRKTVTLLLSQSFSEIILIGGSIIMGLPLPILPVQILWENLIEGSPQGIALAFEPKEKGVMERPPDDPKKSLITQQMKTIIFGFGIITSFILFGLFLWLYSAWGKERLPEIRTIIFAVLAIDTFFYAFSCRNLRKNIWQINIFSNLYLIGAIFLSFLLLLVAIYLPPFQNLLKTQPLSLFGWFLILGLGVINLILIEAIKWYFITKRKIR